MKKKCYYYYLKILTFLIVFIHFSKENVFAQETIQEKYYKKKIGTHFLIEFPNNPNLIENNEEKSENNNEITIWQSVSEDGNMRFKAIHKRNIKNNADIYVFYQKEIKKFVLPINGMLYEQRNIEIEHHKGIKFRVKFRPSNHQKTHKEQTYIMFLVNEDYYLFSYIYDGFDKKPSREAEYHFFQSLKEN